MGQIKDVKVPDIGDFDAVEIIEILVKPGDSVTPEDPLITLESDKAAMDVPSPLAGEVAEVKVAVGDKVGEGDLILTLEVSEEAEEPAAQAGAGEPGHGEGAEAGEDAAVSEEPEEPAKPAKKGADETSGSDETKGEKAEEGSGRLDRPWSAVPPPPVAPGPEPGFARAYASPAVRRFARELGVPLGQVKGTGRKGRILREDVQGFVKTSFSEGAPTAGGPALPPMPEIDFSKFGEVERQPLSRIQKLSAKNVHRSWLHVPHVTQHDEADITELEAFRKEQAEEAKRRGFKLTPVAYLIMASVAALKAFPRFNASLAPEGDAVILKRYYHVGIAVDTDDGLVVPVIKNADEKGLFQLAEELGDVSSRARQGKLKMDELQGASFTITSLGGIGGTAFTPIVNAPEVAILGVSRADWKPVWQDGEWVPRLTLPLSLSYDHRVIDGAAAVRFTRHLAQLLGDIRRLLL